MLGVNINQLFRKSLKDVECNGCVIDKCPCFSGRSYFSSDNCGIGIVKVMFFEKITKPVFFNNKSPFNNAFAFLLIKGGGICPVSKNKT
jgi:hypothetical protein